MKGKLYQDRIIWITGASSGIGEALALEGARQGGKLVLSARRKEELERVAGLTRLPESHLMILPLDVKDHSQFESAAKAVSDRFGRIDLLFNNAGVSSRQLAAQTPLSVDQEIMNINYFGSIALTKAVLPYMEEQQSGQIVVTSSVVGYFATPMRSAYAASKHALHGFYNALRDEVYSDNIRITVLCPGYIKTHISVNALTETGERFNKMSVNQANGMEPDVLAEKVYKKLQKNRRSLNIGGSELLGIYLSRYVPGLFSRMLRRMQKKGSFTQ